ncbi:putative RNA-binding Zn ribbon-like protein [Mycetocola sp. CAN_C7]|uniref:CGNR zinc finger domain-containing protein n=1 Tax=Mycetocola sp. CAN_C7 TaxID=2787724 RepID=UPI0018CBD28B
MHQPPTEPATGQWFTWPEGTRWWFDPSSLALDFAYTGPLAALGGGHDGPRETLRSPADLTAWLSERLPASEATERDLADALRLRGSIGRLALAAESRDEPSAGDIDLLNLYAATPDMPPRLAGGSLQAGRTAARASQALSTLARDAVALFSGETPGHIRRCDADDCGLIYLDTARAGTRRWCSMQRCGNRNKVRAHRARAARGPVAGGPAL